MNRQWLQVVLWVAAFGGGSAFSSAKEVLYCENFDGPGIKQGQSVLDPRLGWKLVSPNDPAKKSVGNVLLGAGKHGWSGNYLEGGTAAAQEAENVFQKLFPIVTSGQVVLSCRAFAPGETSAGSSVGLFAAQLGYSNRGGGWISTAKGWAFWVGRVESTPYPLGELGAQKVGPYQLLQEPMAGAHGVAVHLSITVDLDHNKAWGLARWTDAQGRAQEFKTAVYDWDNAAGNISSVLVSIDRRSGHTGIALDDLRVEGDLPSPQPHPFGQREHVVLQLNGDKPPVSLPAEMQCVTMSWNVPSVRAPYLAYMPEKDRLLMLAACGPGLRSALAVSNDRGKTWSPQRWLSVDGAGQSNGDAWGLTYLGQGRLLALHPELRARWFSSDYGDTWNKTESKRPGSMYIWDPPLLIEKPGGGTARLAQGGYQETGVPFTSTDVYSQGCIALSQDEGRTWSDQIVIPQWRGANEVIMIDASNGDWVAACRTDGPTRFRHRGFDHHSGLGVSISKDKGKTWSDLKLLYEWGRHHPSIVRLPDGRIVMSYVVRLGYPNSAAGYPQFGVEAVVSNDNGQNWDLEHRYILAKWAGDLKGEFFWFSGVQSTSMALLPDETLLTAFGTGFRNTPEVPGPEACKNDIAIVKWRVNPQGTSAK
jgi:hypothetical protein